MGQNKRCCRIFPIVLIAVSAIIAAAIWYFDEGQNQFGFLKSWSDFMNYMGTALFVAIIPIGIFYWLNDKEKYQNNAKQLSLLGFLPAILFLVFIIV